MHMSQSPAIMSTRDSNFRSAWEDRWSKPDADDLLEVLPETARTSLHKFVEGLGGLEGIDRQVIWYGEAWRWTVEYTLSADVHENVASSQTACYIVPNLETPIVCVPLEAPVLERLPIRRLARTVREGIRSAKCAVSIHWATWRPTSKVEAEALTDLVKRKIKISSELSAKASSNGDSDPVKTGANGNGSNGSSGSTKTRRKSSTKTKRAGK